MRHIILGLVSIFILVCGIGKAQSSFTNDSLQMIKNNNELLTLSNQEISPKEVINFLMKEIDSVTPKLDDLANYYSARYFFVIQQIDTALQISNKCLNDDYNKNFSDAKFYNIKAAVLSLKKEYIAAIQTFLKAARGYSNQENILREHLVYNNIANIYLALGDHQLAYKYSKQCYSFLKDYPQNPYLISLIGILAVCENNIGKLDSAKIHIDKGFELLETYPTIKGKVLLNFAQSEWYYKNKEYHQAIPFAYNSAKISKKYNLKQFELMGNILLLNIHNQLEEYELAKDFGTYAYDLTENYTNLSLLHSITDGLSVSYAGIDNYEKAYQFKKLTDSLKTKDRQIHNKRIIDQLVMKYDALNKQNKILKQKTVISDQYLKLEQRKNLLILEGIALFFFLLVIVVIIIINRQQSKLKQQRREAAFVKAINASEEKERDRISRELHDGLASELTALKFELEQNNTSEKSVKILKRAHQMTRRISHNLSPFMIKKKGFVGAVSHFITENNSNGKLHFYTNITEKLSLDSNLEIVLFRSVQELVQNALKHANASEIMVQITTQANEKLFISVEDNGIGIKTDVLNNSVGLGSLKNRIELVNGIFSIDSKPNKGTTALINLMLKK